MPEAQKHSKLNHPHEMNVLSIETPVSLTIAHKTLALSQVLDIAPGTLLRFDKSCLEPLSAEVAGKEVAKATAVQIGDQIGFRVA